MQIFKFMILWITFLLTACQTTQISTLPPRVVGQLKVGFDIDDTVLFSRDNFLKAPRNENNSDQIDFAWINTHDSLFSKLIKPTADLIGYLRSQGHEVYFITARPGINGENLGYYLSSQLGFPVEKDRNLFFAAKWQDPKTGIKYTTKHEVIARLGLHIFYGDSDNDMVAASVAGIRGVRVVRDKRSVEAYSRNYFGDTKSEPGQGSPFSQYRYRQFLAKGVGPYGETIFPLYPENMEPSE